MLALAVLVYALIVDPEIHLFDRTRQPNSKVAKCLIQQYSVFDMVQLADIQKQAKELSEEDRKGLVAFLLDGFVGVPLGPDDEEVERRDAEMDSGEVAPISHVEFLAQVGRQAR